MELTSLAPGADFCHGAMALRGKFSRRVAVKLPSYSRAIKARQRRLCLRAGLHNGGDLGNFKEKRGHTPNVASSSEIQSGSLQFGGEIPTTPTRTITVTVHGVQSEDDKDRLDVDLRTIDGVKDLWIGNLMQGGPRGSYVTVQLQVRSSVRLADLTKEIQATDDKLLILPFKMSSWEWRNYEIRYGVAGTGKPIILVHGFGGNAGHFARLVSYLADHYKVYAIDLLGFGASEKPSSVDYSPDLWADLVSDFAQEFTESGAVLIGNSIGSLTAVTAAAKAGKDLVRGLVLLNCAGAMNRKGLTQDGILLRLLSPVFVAVEYLLAKPRVANFLFNKFRTKDNIRKILSEQAYRNRDAVTDQLVDILYHPSTDEGAQDVFVKIFTSDNPGSRPEKLMADVDVPVLVLWGKNDAWTPATGPVAKFFKRLAKQRSDVEFYALKDVGHCPHDDRPEIAAEYILSFLSSFGW